MRSGRLRDKIVLQEKTSSENTATGQPLDIWIDVGTAWATVEDLSGRDFYEAASEQSQAITPIEMRFRPGVKPKMRVVCGERVFRIDSIQRPTNRRERMILMCSELGPET